MKKTPMKKPKTTKMMNLDPKFNSLPANIKNNIMSYLSRPVGRPKATPLMKEDARAKNQLRMRLNKQAEKALKEGDFEGYIDIVEEQRARGIIGDKAYEKRVDKFINNMKKIIKSPTEVDEEEPTIDDKVKREVALDETSQDIADTILKQAQREVRIEEGAPVKLKVVDEYSEPSIPTERTQQKMQEAAMKRAIATMTKREREEGIRKREEGKIKRSQLADHFSTYDKSKEGKAKQEPPDEPRAKLQKATGIKYNDISKKVQNDIRALLADSGKEFDYDDVEFAWDNSLDEITKERIISGDLTGVQKINDLIDVARQTQKFVPDYLEAIGGMTTEERQIEFHKELIKTRMETIEKRRNEGKTKNNFANNAAAGGGINQGLSTGTLQKDESYKQPTIFENYEEVLDSKLTDDAYVRELLKGIDPNTTSVLGKTAEGDADFFRQLNDISNLQDNAEINDALQNIEILSGGNKDTLFGEQDLLSTRRNNPASRGYFQNDMPYNQNDNPAPVARGRQAMAVQEVDPAQIEREDREGTATTIALGLGVLNTAYRGTFGRNDIPDSRAGGVEDILGSINQSLRLMGRRGLYGDDKSLGKDDEMYEGRSISSRMNDIMAFSSRNNPNYLEQEEKPSSKINELTNAMAMNKGTAMGSSLPQLREQEFAYKQAGRKVAHDGYAFFRGGNATAIKIDQEFDP